MTLQIHPLLLTLQLLSFPPTVSCLPCSHYRYNLQVLSLPLLHFTPQALRITPFTDEPFTESPSVTLPVQFNCC